MKDRNFIQEMIDKLRRASNDIEKQYKQLKAGEITVEEFEEGQDQDDSITTDRMGYKHWLSHLKEDCDNEYYSPNNGCEY